MSSARQLVSDSNTFKSPIIFLIRMPLIPSRSGALRCIIIRQTSILLSKLFDRFGDRFGLFDLRVMPGRGDRLEPGVGQRGGEPLAVSGADEAVLLAPQQQAPRPPTPD